MASYIFYKQKLIDNAEKLNNAFLNEHLNFEIFYSVKTNFSQPVLETINEKYNFEIVSLDEWGKIKNYHKNNIVLNGPSKNSNLVKDIFLNKVERLYFNVDNDTDLDLLEEVNNDKLMVGIRVYFNKIGVWNRFGFDIDSERLQEILNKYKDIIRGFHFHFSTNNFNIDNYTIILDKINHLVERFNLKLEFLDIGGGLPGASEILYQNIVYERLPKLIRLKTKNNILIISEVGRHLVEDVFNLEAMIISLKKLTTDTFDITIDTNITHFPCFWEKKFDIEYQPKNILDKKPVFINIFGNSCMQIDKIADNFLISQIPHVGDKILLTKLGAYSLSQATNFITPIPEILIKS